MSKSERISFQLNEFANNIKTSWQGCQIKNDFCDMTLACDDKQIEAHRIIVSSHSPVLKHILKSNPNQHPLIYLRGVNYKDLEHLMTFLYQGEIDIAQQEVKSFLALAKDLKIKGLTKQNENQLNSVHKSNTSLPIFENTLKQLETELNNLKHELKDGRGKTKSFANKHDKMIDKQVKYEPKEDSCKSTDIDKKEITINADILKIENKPDENLENGEKVKMDDDLNVEFNDILSIKLEGEEDDRVKTTKVFRIKRTPRRKKRKISNEAETPKVWTRDPSPERFVDGKKVKYICVTQANVASGPPYSCVDCGYFSNLIVNVQKHYRKHTNEKPFGCKDCDKKFVTSGSVVSHWNSHHNKNWRKDFSCEICGRSFEFERQLIRHGIVHSGESFVCSVCGKGYKSPWNRDGHEARHSKEVTACPICGKNFPNPVQAEQHQERHEGKNYECDQCDKKSKTKGDLRIHKKIRHTKEGKCQCVTCGKTFRLQLYLTRHIKLVHDKSLQFKCVLCPQVLSSKPHFIRHSRRRHNGQMIPASNRIN